ncbi:MAG TPA: helix-turn-helix transcriptional regulator [Thermoanaerobaculia bacterium]|nr:helix-turn-helix transcriptional regulator [Thermoanaerobaculia bacterium]
MSTARERGKFLRTFGERIRGERARRGMSRKLLAKHAAISERYITQLESGKGNVSIVLLKQIADALGLPLARLIDDEPATAALARMTPGQLREAYASLAAIFDDDRTFARAQRIALVGLRGAGKTTLGQRLARELEVPFFELDREIERISGVSLAHILEMYGQQAYRRYEVQALQDLLRAHSQFVVATGGSLVSEPATYELLLRSCFTVWVRTTPEEHMARVVAQGDQRPMAGSTQAMDDLRRILQEREPLYARADLTVDTTGAREEQSVEVVLRALPAPVAQ